MASRRVLLVLLAVALSGCLGLGGLGGGAVYAVAHDGQTQALRCEYGPRFTCEGTDGDEAVFLRHCSSRDLVHTRLSGVVAWADDVRLVVERLVIAPDGGTRSVSAVEGSSPLHVDWILGAYGHDDLALHVQNPRARPPSSPAEYLPDLTYEEPARPFTFRGNITCA